MTIDKCYRSLLGDEGVYLYINSGECDREIERHVDNLHIISDSWTITGFSTIIDIFIDLMMIDENLHRKGFGTELLSYVETELFKNNETLKFESLEGNTQANNYYLKNGWKVVDKKKDDDFDFVRLVMEKYKGSK